MYVLAKNIYTLRKRFNMTQEELAAKVGVSKATISNYENDITRPACSKLSKIADAFGVTVRDLFEGTIPGYGFDENPEYTKIYQIKSPQKPIRLMGVPYLYIYDDENGDIVIYVSHTEKCMLLDEYDGDEKILTSCENTYYIINLKSTKGEQFVCGNRSVGEIIETQTYESLND